jgi:CheY-like chemotaxis protein
MIPPLYIRTTLRWLVLIAILAVAGLFVGDPPWRGAHASSASVSGTGQIEKPRGDQDALRPIVPVCGVTLVLLLSAAEVVLRLRETVGKRILHLRSLGANLAWGLKLTPRESRFVGPLSGHRPNADEELAAAPHGDAEPAKTDAAALWPFAGKTVLIADDDLDITHSLGLRFERLGMTALRTSNALQLLFGVHRVKPDLVVIDVGMPTGNGLAVCEMLNTDESLASVPMIIYTGSSADATVGRCRALGAHYVLKSPNSWAEIERIVYRLFSPG